MIAIVPIFIVVSHSLQANSWQLRPTYEYILLKIEQTSDKIIFWHKKRDY
jgi:hypothetical protein